MSVFLDDGDVRLYHGDALETLREMPAGTVDMCATSPPFYGLRDYGTEGQIGLEETPDQWVTNLVQVFREVRRVLADHGTLWVEIGDSYNSGGANNNGRNSSGLNSNPAADVPMKDRVRGLVPGMKQKDLIGQPWLLAFALRADGWYLRSEIIWARPNPMPESVTDRPTKAHSTIFLLSKQPRYFYDADAIREPLNGETVAHIDRYGTKPSIAPKHGPGSPYGDQPGSATQGGMGYHPSGANARSVWTIPTQPTPFAHFATWPQKLVGRMIQAGTSEHGCCPECGASWVRETSVELELTQRTHNATATKESMSRRDVDKSVPGRNHVTTLGWSPSCTHDHQPVPCTVLDPFAGSGTTLLTARNHQRHAIGIELNPDYCQIAATRLQQLSLLT